MNNAIFIKTDIGKYKILAFQMDFNQLKHNSVDDLKAMLQKRTSIIKEQQTSIFKDKILENNENLGDCGIEYSSLEYLRLCL